MKCGDGTVRRLFQVIHCVSETLAGQNDQVQSIAENAEERHDRYEELDDSPDVHVGGRGGSVRSKSVQSGADIAIELAARRPPCPFHRRR